MAFEERNWDISEGCLRLLRRKMESKGDWEEEEEEEGAPEDEEIPPPAL